jgi:hypothetical protein
MLLRREIYILTKEYYSNLLENEKLVDDDDLIMDDEFEDTEDSIDALSFDIDNTLTLDLDDNFSYHVYDKIFFLLILNLLLLNGLVYSAIMYIIFGINMAFFMDADESEVKESEDAFALYNYSLKVFHVVDKLIEDPESIDKPINLTDDKLYFSINDFLIILTVAYMGTKII